MGAGGALYGLFLRSEYWAKRKAKALEYADRRLEAKEVQSFVHGDFFFFFCPVPPVPSLNRLGVAIAGSSLFDLEPLAANWVRQRDGHRGKPHPPAHQGHNRQHGYVLSLS